MSTPTQSKYIQDLAVLKTKEYKEVKELLTASGIVGPESTIVNEAPTLADICNALTDLQASQLIDALISTKPPTRSMAYSNGRVRKTIEALDDIKATIDDWGF